ncbi:MAG: hypothetical protein ACK5IN_06330, partial [Microbacterium sp.]
MPFETPEDAPAPLRRTRRDSAPRAVTVDAPLSRAALRNRSAGAQARPTVVWARATEAPAAVIGGELLPAEPAGELAEIAPAGELVPADAAQAAVAPLTRRARRAQRQPKSAAAEVF